MERGRKRKRGAMGVGWGQIETKAGQTVGRTSPSPSSPASCFSSCEGSFSNYDVD